MSRRPLGAWLRRLWPRGIAARVAIILILGVIVFQAASGLLFYRDRHGSWRDERQDRVATRLIAAVRSFETVPVAARPELIEALDSPLLRVRLLNRPPALDGEPPEHGRDAATLRQLEAALRPRALMLRVDEGLEFRGFDDEAEEHEDAETSGDDRSRERDWLLPSRRRFELGVQLNDGSWLQVVTTAGVLPPFRPLRALFWLAAVALVVVLAAGWSARRLARPFEHFAAAADRLGTDITAPPLEVGGSRELRRASEAFNRMQARIRRLVDDRTQMLAALAHDLRTFLTRFRLRVELIDDEVQQQKAIADLEAMRVMLDETLAFARDEAAGEARTEFDLAALAQSLIADAADAGQAARYEGPDRLRFTGRPVALGRALGNLIDNALRYGSEALVELEDRGTTVEVRVLDRGPGIPPEQRDAVFRPFYRIEASRSRETGGTGLGLSVARTVVRRHGGEITLADRQGGGLAVRVQLPRSR